MLLDELNVDALYELIPVLVSYKVGCPTELIVTVGFLAINVSEVRNKGVLCAKQGGLIAGGLIVRNPDDHYNEYNVM